MLMYQQLFACESCRTPENNEDALVPIRTGRIQRGQPPFKGARIFNLPAAVASPPTTYPLQHAAIIATCTGHRAADNEAHFRHGRPWRSSSFTRYGRGRRVGDAGREEVVATLLRGLAPELSLGEVGQNFPIAGAPALPSSISVLLFPCGFSFLPLYF